MASLVHVFGKSVLCRFLCVCVCVSIHNISYISLVEGFQEFNLEVCMVSNTGA